MTKRISKGDKVHVIPPHMLSGSEGKVTKTRGDKVHVQIEDIADPVEIPADKVVKITED
jgi:ribosomal protein L24